jgi:hypothetical protein
MKLTQKLHFIPLYLLKNGTLKKTKRKDEKKE